MADLAQWDVADPQQDANGWEVVSSKPAASPALPRAADASGWEVVSSRPAEPSLPKGAPHYRDFGLTDADVGPNWNPGEELVEDTAEQRQGGLGYWKTAKQAKQAEAYNSALDRWRAQNGIPTSDEDFPPEEPTLKPMGPPSLSAPVPQRQGFGSGAQYAAHPTSIAGQIDVNALPPVPKPAAPLKPMGPPPLDQFQIQADEPPKTTSFISSNIQRVPPPQVDDRSDARRFLETPLISAKDIDEALPFLVGPFSIEKGILKGAAGMTSPEAAGIIAATGGVGALAESTTAGTAQAARVAQSMLSAYFATQSGKAFLQKFPQLSRQWQDGDWQGVLETGGQQLVDAAAATAAAVHSARSLGSAADIGRAARVLQEELNAQESFRATQERADAARAAAARPKIAAPGGPTTQPTSQPPTEPVSPNLPEQPPASGSQLSPNTVSQPTQVAPTSETPVVPAAEVSPAPPRTEVIQPERAAPAAPAGAGGATTPAETQDSGEYHRGAWNVPLNERGIQQVQQAAQNTAGQFTAIYAGTLDRHQDTAAAYAATNPQAGPVMASDAFDPMAMGIHEGERVTPERTQAINEHIVNTPERPLPGVGKYSGVPGEKPQEWMDRLVGAVQQIVEDYRPGEKPLIVTSGRDTQAIRAWAAEGMPEDGHLNTDVLTSEWKTTPGNLMRLDPYTGHIADVADASEPGIYIARHGETDANRGPGVPQEVAEPRTTESGLPEMAGPIRPGQPGAYPVGLRPTAALSPSDRQAIQMGHVDTFQNFSDWMRQVKGVSNPAEIANAWGSVPSPYRKEFRDSVVRPYMQTIVGEESTLSDLNARGPHMASTAGAALAHQEANDSLEPVEMDEGSAPARSQGIRPGWVGNLPTSQINVDAPRFQFKRNVGQGGAGEEFREVRKWDPEKSGVIAVWQDPADGKVYVVNGHHRIELAQRLHVPDVTVRFLDARNAQEARLKGALINIAEGRGDSVDAAKVFRDTGMTEDDLRMEGISLKGKIASEGMALSKLARPLFEDVLSGALPEARGAVLGANLPNHADQIAVYDLMKQREKGGKRLTNDQVEELIRLNNRSGTVTESSEDSGQGGLFGVEEMPRSLLPEKAEVSDYVRKQLASEKKLFGTVATQAAAERLGETGNVIKAGENAEVAQRANQGSVLYDKLSTSAGAIDQVLDNAAREIADGKNATEVKQRAYRAIRDELTRQVRKLTGLPAQHAPRAQKLGREGANRQPPVPNPSLEPVEDVAGSARPLPGDQSLFTPAEEEQSRVADQLHQDRVLGSQLTAQLRSGMAARPSKLKPATNRGLFEDREPEQDSLFVDIEGSLPIPGFYSQLSRTVDAKTPAKASPQQVLNIVRNPQSGVKPDELHWTGLDTWLEGQKGPVTKQEVRDFLKQNAVQVEEVTHGEGAPVTWQEKEPGKWWSGRNGQTEFEIVRTVLTPKEKRLIAGGRYPEYHLEDVVANKSLGDFETLDAAQKAAASHPATRTKYGSYVTPGGSNYRELLLTLPPAKAGKLPEGWYVVGPGEKPPSDQWKPQNSYRVFSAFDDLLAYGSTRDHAIQQALEDTGTKPQSLYQSSHWDEPNVLAHIRFDDRKGPNGERYMHLAEVQGDWGQEGRRKGYQVYAPHAQKRLAEIKSEWDKLSEKLHQNNVDVNAAKSDAEIDRLTTEHQRLVAETRRLSVEEQSLKKQTGGVPPMPFPKTWHELAFRRALRYAVEHGYDALTWDTGETQAARYDLSQHISKISYQPSGPDQETKGGFTKLWIYDKDEDPVQQQLTERIPGSWWSDHDKAAVIPNEKLPDVVGKELADKILAGEGDTAEGFNVIRKHDGVPVRVMEDKGAAERYAKLLQRQSGVEHEVVTAPWAQRSLEGLDLKVGGEGMKGFYDKILPEYANKLGKKWGSKVGSAQIQTGKEEPTFRTAQDILESDLGIYWDEATPEQRQRAWEKKREEDAALRGKPKTTTVHVLPITPAMAASVMEGQPLFYRPPVIPQLSDPNHGEYVTGAPTSTHAALARMTPIRLEGPQNGIVDAYLLNPSAMELIGRGAGKAPDAFALNYAGLHLGPKAAGSLARNLGILMRQMGGPSEAPPAIVELQKALADASTRGKSFAAISSSPDFDKYRDIAMAEELRHAIQSQLTGNTKGHMGGGLAGFVADPLYQKAAGALRTRYSDLDPGSGAEAAEVGVRLMYPDGYKELTLSPEEARTLAARYVRQLRSEYGSQKPRDIAREVFDALRGTGGAGTAEPRTGTPVVRPERPAGAGRGAEPAVPGNERAAATPGGEVPGGRSGVQGTGGEAVDQARPVSEDGKPLGPVPAAGEIGSPFPAPDSIPLPDEPDLVKQFLGEETGSSALTEVAKQLAEIFKTDVAEAKAKKAQRKAALAALEQSALTPGQKAFGQRIIEFYTGELGWWITRVNQVLDRLRRLVPAHVEQEALSLMRDFKKRPGEMQQFLDGTHPAITGADDPQAAADAIAKIRPAIEKALNPTRQMKIADKALTKIAEVTLKEGQAYEFLDSTIPSDEYQTHILHPKDEEFGSVPLTERIGKKIGGKMSRRFAYAQQRHYPTLLHAIADGVKPRTLNAFDAFTIHGDKFAVTRATKMLIDVLKTQGVGKWGSAGVNGIPDDWRELAGHSGLFRNQVKYLDSEGNPQVAQQSLMVPPLVQQALRPITDPNYMAAVRWFHDLRMKQALLKQAELSLSLFHVRAMNLMAFNSAGPIGWAHALRADVDSPLFVKTERDMVLHGGTSPIQGKTAEAYRALQPGSIPSWGDIWRGVTPMKQVDQVAEKITHLTFDVMQRKFKVTDYGMHVAAWEAEHPNAPEAELTAAKKSIAKYVNAVYGGLNWENLHFNRATLEVMRAIMLAPDWTISNIFNVDYAMEGGPKAMAHQAASAVGLGGKLPPGWEGSPAGKLARAFWLKYIPQAIIATQLMSLLLTGKRSRHMTKVYLGKDREGNEIYQNWFMAGAPQDAMTLMDNAAQYGAFVGTVRTMANKTAPGLHVGMDLATNQDFLRRPIVHPGMNPVASTIRGGMYATRGALPIPYTVQNAADLLLGPQAHKYYWWELPTTLFAGNPPLHEVGEGLEVVRKKRGGETIEFVRPKRPQKERQSIWDEIRSNKR